VTADEHSLAANLPAAGRWPSRADLLQRLAAARGMLQNCELCELRCGVNRGAGERRRCRLAADTHVYKTYASLNEEAELIPALRVFLGGCNFRCPWCDEAPDAFEDAGQRVEPADWADELTAAVAGGVCTISILGGEPTLHVPTLLALAAAVERPLPLALNTNMYMSPAVIELLDGVVQWYLADFKFGNDECARQYAGVPRYSDVVRRNLLSVARQAELVIRHVLMPGHLGCCFQPVADWAAEHLPGVRFQLYPGYVPCGPASCDATLGRLNTRADVRAATDYLARLDLRSEPTPPSSARVALPLAHDTGTASLTLGVDGRIYCHDLTPELAAVLSEICPEAAAILARQEAAGCCADQERTDRP
jgi:putative pyruvate formate lyase activating enzyme